jgi:hypothetical protein
MNKSFFTKIGLVILFTFSFSFLTFGQTPNMFKYQAVLRDASGNIIANQSKTIVIDILESDLTTSVFNETQDVTTSAQGLINLNIGSVNTTDLALIDWSNGEYFIQITVDATIMGTSQLLSVPYALYAKNGTKWETNLYGDIFRSGKIGIGTNNPGDAYSGTNSVLHLYSERPWLNLESFSGIATLQFKTQNGDWHFNASSWGGVNKFQIWNNVVDPQITFDGNTGFIGLGTDSPTSKLQVVGLPEYADNDAAVNAGLTVGAFYRTGDLLKVVH